MSDPAAKDEPVPAILRFLRAIDGVVRRVEIVTLVTVLVTMITLAFAQVLMRKLRPIFPEHVQEVPWFDILNRHLVLWVAILGASIAAREGRHFGVEILPKLFSERGKRRLDIVLNAGAGLVGALIAVAMWKYVVLSQTQILFVVDAIQLANETDSGTHGLGVDRRWLISIMPVGLALMTARFFLRALEAALLSDHQWHAFERELKPDLQAAPAPAPEAPPAPAPPGPPAPAPDRPDRKHKDTDEVKVRRLGDLDDVTDPEPRAGGPPPPDPEEALVDSDMVMAQPEDEASAAPTERAPRADAETPPEAKS